MAVLNDRANSSTKRQHQRLVLAAGDRGFDLHELRRMVGGSLRALSALQCSLWIQSFSGKPLPHPPGQKPAPYSRRPEPRGSARAGRPVRMILSDHVEQIERLALAYFDGSRPAFDAWLFKFHHVHHPREFNTAAKATAIITVLKKMLARRAPS